MSRIAYLAEPIDWAETAQHFDWIPSRLAELGWVVFRPATAWRVSCEVGPEVELVNRFALAEAGLMIAVLPSGVKSVGVPREIEFARQRGIPVAVLTNDDRRGWALADVPCFPNIESLDEWLPTPGTPQPRSIVFDVMEGGTLPTRAHAGDAGFDLYTSQHYGVRPGEFADIPCGVRVALPEGTWAQITGRSSTRRRWSLHVIDGVIDSGFRGQLFCGVQNTTNSFVEVPKGTRLAQLILHHNLAPRYQAMAIDPIEFEKIPGDTRGAAGFGSSGQ